MIADTNPIRSAWACKFEKLDSRGHDNNVPCSPLGPQGTSQVEMGGIEPEWRNCNEKRWYAPFCTTTAPQACAEASAEVRDTCFARGYTCSYANYGTTFTSDGTSSLFPRRADDSF